MLYQQLIALHNRQSGYTWEESQALQDEIDAAELDYDSTPVGCFSAWNESEREFVVNRGGKYKIVAIQHNVVYEKIRTGHGANGDMHARNTTVIQLEEI